MGLQKIKVTRIYEIQYGQESKYTTSTILCRFWLVQIITRNWYLKCLMVADNHEYDDLSSTQEYDD